MVPDPKQIDAAAAQAQPRATVLAVAEFFDMVAVGHPTGIQGAVFLPGAEGGAVRHMWNRRGAPFSQWAPDKVTGRCPAYYTLAAFDAAKVTDFKGRSADNVVGLRVIVIDIEGTVAKGGYEGPKATAGALKQAVSDGLPVPNVVVPTGSGGLHAYWILDAWVVPEAWLQRAQALRALCAKVGLKIDAQVTTDAARIMRAPGSLHQKTKREVKAVLWRKERYTLAELSEGVGYVPEPVTAPAAVASAAQSINADVLEADHKPFSYVKAAKECGALALAAKDNGAGVAYPVWVLALRTAALSVEGVQFAHQISSGHADYDPAKTDAKLASLTGGPAGCDKWADAYGPGGPCGVCRHRGRIKNPAVQLGTLDAASGGIDSVDQTTQFFIRYSILAGRVTAIVDHEATDDETGMKVVELIELHALRMRHAHQFAPAQGPNQKPRSLVSYWLSHPDTRRYEGTVFTPGKVVPLNKLQLWTGWAVAPAPGDVTWWLDVLAALVPDPKQRLYVLCWIAWKIQNPGDVPDTVLIFRGGKGVGKDSLFVPLLKIFGRHAMVTDSSELVAGRFTWHLIYKALAVLNEAVATRDPKQADAFKNRITARAMMYEQKKFDPVQGINRCAFVILTNHEHAWQATPDERRAVVIDMGGSLRANLDSGEVDLAKLKAWEAYHAIANTDARAGVLLHYLQNLDLTGFNPRAIPKGEPLRKQIELTALRDPVVAWWTNCLSEGAVRWHSGGVERRVTLGDSETEIDRAGLRLSYDQSATVRGWHALPYAAVSRRLNEWAGPEGIAKRRQRNGTAREWIDVLPPLPVLRSTFTEKTKVLLSE